MSNHAPDTKLEGTTDSVRMAGKLHKLWIAHQSMVDSPKDRSRLKRIAVDVEPRRRVSAGQDIECTDPDIAAYLRRIGKG